MSPCRYPLDMTTEKVTGRDSDKIMLRVPDGMRDRIAEVAKANGRSMNAEIVARLQASFDAGAGKEIAELQRDLELERLRTQKERFDALGAKLISVQLASIADPAAIAKHPGLAQAASKLKQQERELMLDMLEHTILGIAEVPKIMERGIKAGTLKVIPESDGPTKLGKLPDTIQHTSSALQNVLGSVGEDVLHELFARPRMMEVFSGRTSVADTESQPVANKFSKSRIDKPKA